ncbi:hypothetical protein OG349_30845 [Streptomyces sp. NBC_01317]|uniref:hypothetical protein n=1 Tax=Streptomyces sp. NBC_01317 TaxID=2903822 RepID=UPI002E126C91|nr:hypothetical protein OG349_30845 [Streptomyces sp. NBC_01317]
MLAISGTVELNRPADPARTAATGAVTGAATGATAGVGAEADPGIPALEAVAARVDRHG